MEAATKRLTLEEIPIDKLKELQDQHPDVLLYFRRQNAKGQMESLASKPFPMADLLTDGVENYLRDLYGGGSYIVEVRNIALHTEELVTRYRITVQGQRIGSEQPYSRATAYAAPTQREVTLGYHFEGRAPIAAGYQPPGARPSDFMSNTPDAIALDQLRTVREELARLRREAGERDRKHAAEKEQLRQRLEDQRLATEKANADARDRELRAQYDSLRAELLRKPEPQKPAIDFTALAAIFAAFVPVLTAMINSSKERQQLQLNSQQHSSDQHTNMLLALMKRDDGGKSGLELVMTLLPKLMEANNPGKIADVIATMGESQMQTLAMAAQAIQALAPAEDSPGMMIVKTALDGVMGIADQFQHRQLASQQPPQPQQRVLAPQQQAPVAEAQVVPAAEAQQAQQVQPAAGAQQRRQRPAPNAGPRTPRELAKAIISDPIWPADMKSQQWVFLLTTLHSDRAPTEIGEEIASMLQGMNDTGRLAKIFDPMFEDGGPPPSELLRQVFAPLPIAQPDYADHYNAILATIDAQYAEEDGGDELADDATNGVDGSIAVPAAVPVVPATE